MTQRQRKFAGTVILLLFLCLYALIAMAVGVGMLPAASKVGAFFYYLVAGLLWTIPAAALISWMQRPDPPH